MLRRRSVLSALLCLPAASALADGDDEPMPKVGPVQGTVALRVPDDKFPAFMHDLVDFANFYGMRIVGDPANMSVQGRPILIIWYTRDDGITVLVTDAAEHEQMQAFFFVAVDGQPRDAIPDIMQGYRNKMSGYPPFTKQIP